LVLKRAQVEPLCTSCLFIDDIVDFIEEGNTHAPLTGEVSTPAVLFASGLALGTLTAQTLQKRVDIR
jgi:hypothetical protein